MCAFLNKVQQIKKIVLNYPSTRTKLKLYIRRKFKDEMKLKKPEELSWKNR
jgi:hypothetical protein